MTVLPGMPIPHAPEALKGCEHGCVNGQVETPNSTDQVPEYYPCPLHNADLFKRWSVGKVGWRATESNEPRRFQ